MTLFSQADLGTIETATKLFGPMGAVVVISISALIYVFRLYREEVAARIQDAKERVAESKELQKTLEELAPYLARLSRRMARAEDSEPPPPSRARIRED